MTPIRPAGGCRCFCTSKQCEVRGYRRTNSKRDRTPHQRSDRTKSLTGEQAFESSLTFTAGKWQRKHARTAQRIDLALTLKP